MRGTCRGFSVLDHQADWGSTHTLSPMNNAEQTPKKVITNWNDCVLAEPHLCSKGWPAALRGTAARPLNRLRCRARWWVGRLARTTLQVLFVKRISQIGPDRKIKELFDWVAETNRV